MSCIVRPVNALQMFLTGVLNATKAVAMFQRLATALGATLRDRTKVSVGQLLRTAGCFSPGECASPLDYSAWMGRFLSFFIAMAVFQSEIWKRAKVQCWIQTICWQNEELLNTACDVKDAQWVKKN